jgi:hypothetical protein
MLKKINTIALLLLLVTYVKAEKLPFQINGIVKGENHYQYAYLYLSESEKLLKAKIENQQFLFVGEFTLEKKGFNTAFLFLSNDSSDKYIALQEVILKKIDRQYRSVMMDGTLVSITIEADVKNAKVEGGKLNRDYDEMNLAIRELKYKGFIESHRDSPISLLLIRSILPLKRAPIINRLDFQELYDKLSDELKQSEYGLETLKRIKDS